MGNNNKTYLTAQYFLNHKLELSEIRRQVREFADKGFQGIFAHARQGLLTPYMSKNWWNCIDVIMEECKHYGMNFHIWDEDYFPSATVGGRITWEHPELSAQNLNFSMQIFENHEEIEMDFKKGFFLKAFAIELDDKDKALEITDIAESCGTRRQEWTERELIHTMYSPNLTLSGNPHWQCGFGDNRFAAVWNPPHKGRFLIIGVTVQFNQNRTCLMDPRTAKAVLDSTYEEYYKRYGAEFGKLLNSAFFDEPSSGSSYPWCKNFDDEFFKDHSYHILDNLAHVAWELDEKTFLVRLHYRETQHRLLAENYLIQTGDWCRSHNIVFSGHLTRTEWFSLAGGWWPNELRIYKHVDIPCCDPLGKAFGFRDTAPYHSGIKLVSSAARIFGKDAAGSDCLAVVGDEISIRDLKAMLDYQIVLGITYFISHGYSYSFDGPRKDEVPPSIFYQHSEWEYMGKLSSYIKSVCGRISSAKRIVNILVLYPSTDMAVFQRPDKTFWPHTESQYLLEEEKKFYLFIDDMLSNHCDFDFIDEITLEEKLESPEINGFLKEYKIIILPNLKYIRKSTLNCLKRYISSGVKIIFIGAFPEILSNHVEKMDFTGMTLVSSFDRDILPETSVIKGKGAEDIFVAKYRENLSEFYFLYNRSLNDFKGSCDGLDFELPGLGGIILDSTINTIIYKKYSFIECRSFDIEFNENQLGMGFFQVFDENEIADADYNQGKSYEIQKRAKNPVFTNSGKTLYRYRCSSSGSISSAKIVMDKSAVSGEWTIYVNGNPVTNWKKERFYDCNNIFAEIDLKNGNSPQLNVIDIITYGGSLNEMPYLYGKFKAFYKHGHRSFPELHAVNTDSFHTNTLCDWSIWGYPTYSGTVSYTSRFAVQESGHYILDLGRVEDIAEISLDSGDSFIIAWPPYTCEMELEAGEHCLNVKITNGPGNMFRDAGLPAGLLGPLYFYKIR